MANTYNGVPVSPGYVIAPLWVYRPIALNYVRNSAVSAKEEQYRLQRAQTSAVDQLVGLYEKALKEIGEDEAEIFMAHQMLLDDPDLFVEIEQKLGQGCTAEAAVDEAVHQLSQSFEEMENEYFRERANDVRDVGRRLIHCLQDIDIDSLVSPKEPVIVVAEDLSPSDVLLMDTQKLLGICIAKGGPTSHVSILARSLGIPAMVNTGFHLDAITTGSEAVIDACDGAFILSPDSSQRLLYSGKKEAFENSRRAQLARAQEPAHTRDGHKVDVFANISSQEDARKAVELGAEGIGLFRTEMLYLDSPVMPEESALIREYSEINSVVADKPIVVRTLDIGGDKQVDYLGLQKEENPFLGWRAIRMISEQPEILKKQFKTLLTAFTGNLKIMLPLVSNIQEIRSARQLLNEAQNELAESEASKTAEIEFGIMIEVPSAALMAEQFAEEVDFFSIGTNDLTQYTLAVDRGNERVANLASYFHPAVLKLIDMTVRGAHTKGKWVGLCGEMAGDPLASSILLGLGIDEFSMSPNSIPAVKERVRSLHQAECIELAKQCLQKSSADQVVAELAEFSRQLHV